MMIFEVCVDSVEGALAAQEGGAQRVELCSGLVEGGLTPSLGLIELARRSISIDLNVLIRPRGGDFLYSELEVQVMERDILAARQAGADGVVIGLLRADGSLDVDRTRRLVELARPLSVTFHRAMDLCRSPDEALEALIEMGVERVLTSGQAPTALEGAQTIARWVRQAAGRIRILAGGGVKPENLPALVAATGIGECHFSARRLEESPMRFRSEAVKMGKTYEPDEYVRYVPEIETVRRMVTVLEPEPPVYSKSCLDETP